MDGSTENGNPVAGHSNSQLATSTAAASAVQLVTNATTYDTMSYRNKLEVISSPDSPNSSPCDTPRSSYVRDLVRRRENNHADSPAIAQLARKTEGLLINTPKSRKLVNEVAFNTDDSSVRSSGNDDATSNSSETGWSESYDVNISDNDKSEMDEQIIALKALVPKHKSGMQLSQGPRSVFAPAYRVKLEKTLSDASILDTTSKSPTLVSDYAKRIDANPTFLPQVDDLQCEMQKLAIVEPIVHQIDNIQPLNHETKQPVPDSASPFVVSTQRSVNESDVVVIECSSDSNIDPKPAASSASAKSPKNRTKLINNTEQNTISIDTRGNVHPKKNLNKEKSEEVLNGRGNEGGIMENGGSVIYGRQNGTFDSNDTFQPFTTAYYLDDSIVDATATNSTEQGEDDSLFYTTAAEFEF